MCVYEATYNQAINNRDAANIEIERCKEAISYFEEWKSKVLNCYNVTQGMLDQNRAIASQCNEIILNGKPIDEGERHYPNGNGEKFSINLMVIKGALYRLKNEIENQLEKLNKSLNESIKKRDAANTTLRNTPVPPCGYCNECNPPAPTVTSTPENKTNNEKKSTRTPRNRKRQPYNSPYETLL